jgi:dipeptidase D
MRTVLESADQAAILAALHAAPHGVKRMSQRVSGVVETSNNLGVVRVEQGKVFANLMVRSLLDSGTWMLAREVESLFGLAGFAVEMEGGYPGWAPIRSRRCWPCSSRFISRSSVANPACR